MANTKTESLQSTISDVENANIKAKNIYMEADNITDSNTNIIAKDNAILNSKKNIDIKGANISADKILLEAEDDINLTSELGFKSSGEHAIIKNANVNAKSAIEMKSKNVNIYGANVETEKGLVKIDTKKLNVKDLSTINVNYKAELKEGEGRILKDHQYIKDLQAKVVSNPSKIVANKVFVTAKNGANIIGSLVSGKDADSIVQISSDGDVNIKNSNNIDYSNFSSDSRGKNEKGVYKLVKIDKNSKENLKVVGSNLKSEGNINIKSKNLTVTASKIKANKGVNLEAEEDIKLLAALNSQKENLSKMEWGSGAINSHTESLDKKDVESTTIESGEKVNIHAKKDLHKQSVIVKGGTVNMNADGNNYSDALASTETKKETNVNVGLGAKGKVSFAGMGASGEVSSLDNTAKGKVSGIKGLLEKDNEFKDAEAKGEVYAKMDIESKLKEKTTYVNNKIIAENGDVNIGSKNLTDIGNTDISSKKDINITGKKVVTNTKENTTKEVNHKVDLTLKGDINFSNENVNKLNQIVNDGIQSGKEMIENKNVPGAIEKASKTLKDITETIPNFTKKDILGIKSNQGLDFTYTNKTSTVSETTASSMNAGGKVNIKATEDDITLKNTNIKAQEFNAETPKNVNLLAGEKTVHNEENSVNIGLGVNENVGVNITDGATAKVGVNIKGNYNGGTDLKKESLNSTVVAEKTEYKANAVNEDNKTTSYYNDKRGAGINTELKIGVSSNHVIAADGTVGGNVNYSFAAGKSSTDAKTKKVESTDVKAGAKFNGSISTDGKNPNFSAGTDKIEYKKDGKTIVNIKPMDNLITKDKIDKIADKVKNFKNPSNNVTKN